jgi:anti-anti-sigma factor
MKRHLNSSTTGQDADGQDTTGANGTGAAAAPARLRPHLRLVQTRLWNHTLILKGDLDRGSAPELEDELECLRQEGVTALTLDLRQLDALEPSAAHVIAFQNALFTNQGRRFGVLVSSPAVHRVLTDAGVGDLVRPAPAEGLARRYSSSISRSAAPDVSTTMIRDLRVA